MGGKAQFPYMIDPNTGTSMYESDDIIRYLFKTYGNQEGEIPSSLKGGFFTTLSCALGMMFRSGKGSAFREAKVAKQPLILYGYEASPFCKIVRERLVELEIPHVYKTSARGSSKRSELYKKIGLFQVPYLEDPNTKVAMLESADILKYLETTYAVAPEL